VALDESKGALGVDCGLDKSKGALEWTGGLNRSKELLNVRIHWRCGQVDYTKSCVVYR
jgi:hypothetical protein